MPRPITTRFGIGYQYQPSPKQIPTPRTLLVPPGGMDRASRLNTLAPSMSRLVQNLAIKDGVYQRRMSVDNVGTPANSPVVYAAEFVLSTGDAFLIRWHEQGLDYYNAGTWENILGAVVQADVNTGLCLTSWNDTIVFGTQYGRLYELAFYPVPTLTEIVDAPEGATHLCTFNNRIIASIGRKIKWCVSRDNRDWTGKGSGEEEFLGAPGGKVDQQTAVYPISDEKAVVIRTNSLWQLSVTGNFDAPFTPSRVRSEAGGRYPLATCEIPNGVAFLGLDNVFTFTVNEGLQPIGSPIRREILSLQRSYLRHSCLIYDPRENQLRLSIPDGNMAGHRVYRFDLGLKAWTLDRYPFPIRALSFTRFAQSNITIDELDQLANTIDTLPSGTIDDLGVTDHSVGAVYAIEGESKRVFRDSDTGDLDVDAVAILQPIEWRVETAYIFAGASIEDVQITGLHIEYEADNLCELLVEYSDDGGNTWTLYDVLLVDNTAQTPQIVRATGSIARKNLCIAVSCAESAGFKLIAIHPVTDTGGLIADES